jgi:DNA repair photolyase
MKNEPKLNFEQKGLIIEKDRVLTYSKLICPLECKYCFVEALNNDQQKRVAYLSEEQLTLLSQLPINVRTIMLGCDTEFLQNRKEALSVLEKLVLLGKNISIITKLTPDQDFINKLKIFNQRLVRQGNVLTFSISIPCVDSSSNWELKVPTPKRRIECLNNANESGLPCMVAIRPLIPNLNKTEIDYIIDNTHTSVFGYYSGPLYLKKTDQNSLSLIDLLNPDILVEEVQPDWMPLGNIFLKIENKELMNYLKTKAAEVGKPVFEGAADGIDFLLNKNND